MKVRQITQPKPMIVKTSNLEGLNMQRCTKKESVEIQPLRGYKGVKTFV